MYPPPLYKNLSLTFGLLFGGLVSTRYSIFFIYNFKSFWEGLTDMVGRHKFNINGLAERGRSSDQGERLYKDPHGIGEIGRGFHDDDLVVCSVDAEDETVPGDREGADRHRLWLNPRRGRTVSVGRAPACRAKLEEDGHTIGIVEHLRTNFEAGGISHKIDPSQHRAKAKGQGPDAGDALADRHSFQFRVESKRLGSYADDAVWNRDTREQAAA